ncbi:MAG TPA: AsmA family protein [Planctomycetes bacterium]|nr:AsmA family protein [Planctomycetota bacterium]
MKKVLVKILVVILVLVVVLAIFVNLLGDRLLKAGIETAATRELGVGVTVEDASLALFGGTLDLRSLAINNPAGYEHPTLLELGSAHVEVDVKSLLSDTVKIKDIKLDGVTAVVEQKGLSNNLNTVLAGIPSKEKQDDKSAEAKKPGKKLQIANLEVSNVKVKVKLLPIPGKADTVELTLAPIRMTNLGGEQKLDTAKLTSKVLTAIAKGVAKQGTDVLPTEIVGPIKSTLTDQGALVVETGKKVLEESKDLGEDIIEKGKGIGEGAVDAIKGIFGGDKE